MTEEKAREAPLPILERSLTAKARAVGESAFGWGLGLEDEMWAQGIEDALPGEDDEYEEFDDGDEV